MRKTLKALMLMASLLWVPPIVHADWGDVYMMLIYQLENNQFLPLLNNLSQLTDIKSLNQQTLANLEGNFGYGNLYNTANDVVQRQWSNNNWIDVLNMVNSDQHSAFYQAQKNYAERYQIMNPTQFGSQQGITALNKQYYSDSSAVSRAALAASSYSYNQINQHMQTIHDILQKLENQPSEKAALDLNARLVAELSFIQLEQLRMQNIQTQLIANHSQGEVNGMSDQANFMQWNP